MRMVELAAEGEESKTVGPIASPNTMKARVLMLALLGGLLSSCIVFDGLRPKTDRLMQAIFNGDADQVRVELKRAGAVNRRPH